MKVTSIVRTHARTQYQFFGRRRRCCSHKIIMKCSIHSQFAFIWLKQRKSNETKIKVVNFSLTVCLPWFCPAKRGKNSIGNNWETHLNLNEKEKTRSKQRKLTYFNFHCKCLLQRTLWHGQNGEKELDRVWSDMNLLTSKEIHLHEARITNLYPSR